jgi:hypothetical protein
MLEFTKTDLARCETVMKALKRGKYELEGDEVLAFAQAFAWLSQTFDRISTDLSKPVNIEMTYESKTEKKAKK